MKALKIVIFCFSFFNMAYSQEERSVSLGFADVFVLGVKLKEQTIRNSCYCFKSKEECVLYEIEIMEVLYCAENNVFDSLMLHNIAYMTFPVNEDVGKYRDSVFYVTAKPSTSKLYLSFSRKVAESAVIQRNIIKHRSAYLSDLVVCRNKRDVFEKFIKAKKGS